MSITVCMSLTRDDVENLALMLERNSNTGECETLEKILRNTQDAADDLAKVSAEVSAVNPFSMCGQVFKES